MGCWDTLEGYLTEEMVTKGSRCVSYVPFQDGEATEKGVEEGGKQWYTSLFLFVRFPTLCCSQLLLLLVRLLF